jgi:hypothetical protein
MMILAPIIPPTYPPFPALRTTTGHLVDVLVETGRADLACRPGLKYCEDVTFWDTEELALSSCDPGRASWNTVMVYFFSLVRCSETVTYDN